MTLDSDDPPSATRFQWRAKSILDPHYDEVQVEWISSIGTDALSRDAARYAPRVDIAIGPFNTAPGRAAFHEDQIWTKMRPWFDGLAANSNPRCLIAIEVVFSGSAKHLLGDILNASALGLYGLVICRESMFEKVKRNREYLEALATAGKLPTLFQNVRIISVPEFVATLG